LKPESGRRVVRIKKNGFAGKSLGLPIRKSLPLRNNFRIEYWGNRMSLNSQL
jgi:hypothetical protein